MINQLKKLAFTACMLNACAAYAIDDSVALNLTEDDYIGEVPKVLTVSRLAQSKEDAPSAVTVIDSATIRASGIVDIPEIFRLVPGFYVGKNAGFIYNSNHVVSYHGMASAYAGSMQVLINGRSVYSPYYGGVNWSELPITVDDIHRIEITRGPNAASYGANSFFGVISIITKDAKDSTGSSVRLTHGTGRNEAFYRYGGELADVNFRVSAGYREDDGLDNRNDFKRTNILNVQANKRLDASNQIDFEFGITNGDRADGESVKDFVLFVPRMRDISSDYELIRWRHNVSDDSDFSLQAYHSMSRSNDNFTTTNLQANATKLNSFFAGTLAVDQISINNDTELNRYDIEAQHTFVPASNWRMVWGSNIRLDTTYARHWLGNGETDSFSLQRLFGHAEWRINEQFLVNIGSMLEHNDFTGTDVSPRASLNVKLSQNHTLRFGISRATRTPNYIEKKFNDSILIPTVIPNQTFLAKKYADKGDVGPERIVSKEIGYLGQIGNLNIDARVFDDDISNLFDTQRVNLNLPSNILLVSKPRARTYINNGDANVSGFETQVKYSLFKNTQLIANFSHVNINSNQLNAIEGALETSMPKNTFSALITHQFDDNWDVSYAYYQTGAVTALGDGQPVGLNRRHDVRVARKFDLSRAKGELSIAVENLFDDNYQEFARYNTVGRRALVNLNLDF
jgi:iron complex outermembrane recepter protein